jgi:hypothetical protein
MKFDEGSTHEEASETKNNISLTSSSASLASWSGEPLSKALIWEPERAPPPSSLPARDSTANLLEGFAKLDSAAPVLPELDFQASLSPANTDSFFSSLTSEWAGLSTSAAAAPADSDDFFNSLTSLYTEAAKVTPKSLPTPEKEERMIKPERSGSRRDLRKGLQRPRGFTEVAVFFFKITFVVIFEFSEFFLWASHLRILGG